MIFAFGHRRYVGKDTAAKFLINHIRLEHCGRQVYKVSFAYELKCLCYRMFGHLGLKQYDYYELNPLEKDVMIPALGMTAREVWIRVGNYMRAIYNDVWVDIALANTGTIISLVTDMRYHNEADAIKQRGGILIKINRDCIEKSTDVADSSLEFYDGWDYVINNNGSLGDFHAQVTAIVDKELQCQIQ